MNERYLATIEYPKIIAQLADYTSFSAGRTLALALRPSPDEVDVREWQRETSEARALLAVRPDIGVGAARDVRPSLTRAALEGLLQPQELLDIRRTLGSARVLRNVLLRLEADYPLLADKGAGLDPLPELYDAIGSCLDDDGRVLDSASPELARIRAQVEVARDRLAERLHRLVTSQYARYLQEPIVTERNGRYVVPLKVEFKGRIPGIIHDQSSSGATLFIEPLETVELNNRWHELQLAEAREVERILMALSMQVGREADLIEHDVELLAQLDLALAKGRYSFALHALSPDLAPHRLAHQAGDQPTAQPVVLIRARHPLLPAASVVPIDVRLGGDYSVLLVTGPNTGGKTVALKTVGLLAAMFQAGLHLPVAEGSRLPAFTGIYADIGDEQSIEQSLSTFSSHMTHIIAILQEADAGSLVLLDELGAGTDPVEGAALAQALITTLLGRRCLTLCSTHYSELKVFAYNTPGVQNASVEFDLETLSPTYRLVIGLPGRSNALAIAQRLGLDERIIAQARQLVAPEDLEADTLLANIKRADEETAQAQREAEQSRTQAQALEQELRRKLAHIEEERRQALEAAHAEGRRDLERLRDELRRLRASMVEQAPAAGALQEALKVIDRLEETVAPITPAPEPPVETPHELRVGDTVYVASLGQMGELLSLDGQEAEVRVGGFRLRTQANAVEFRSRPAARTQATDVGLRQQQPRSPGLELDLRGWRAEDVTAEVDKYLDDAYLAGLPWVHIIHGKGMGILKEVVRRFLSEHPLVASFRPGGQGEGGEGVTVVTLLPRNG